MSRDGLNGRGDDTTAAKQSTKGAAKNGVSVQNNMNPFLCRTQTTPTSKTGAVLVPKSTLKTILTIYIRLSRSPLVDVCLFVDEVVTSFTSGGTVSNLGIERCGKINGLNLGAETWTRIGVVAGFLAGMDMIEWFYLKIAKLPKKKTISSNIII